MFPFFFFLSSLYSQGVMFGNRSKTEHLQRRYTPFEYCNQNESSIALMRVENLDLQIDINLLLSAVATSNLNFQYVFSSAACSGRL